MSTWSAAFRGACVYACALLVACASVHRGSDDGGRVDVGADVDAGHDMTPDGHADASDACADQIGERALRCGAHECLAGDTPVPCPEFSCARVYDVGSCGPGFPGCAAPLVTFRDGCGCGCIDPAGTLPTCQVSTAESGCGPGEFCDAPCAWASGIGFCRDRPVSCEATWRPACSCGDKLLFANECEAQRSGRSASLTGATCDLSFCGQPTVGVGDCDVVLGFVWNGSRCVELRGCSCEGRGCMLLLDPSETECEARYLTRCGPGTAAPCRSVSECAVGEFCHFPFEDPCGAAGATGTCRPTGCQQLSTRDEPVCGCDGISYVTACSAWRSRSAIAYDGPC